jgi:hypothetical protein
MNTLVQFFLIDHLGATGAVVGTICLGLKVWIIYNCPSHPYYRGRP